MYKKWIKYTVLMRHWGDFFEMCVICVCVVTSLCYWVFMSEFCFVIVATASMRTHLRSETVVANILINNTLTDINMYTYT